MRREIDSLAREISTLNRLLKGAQRDTTRGWVMKHLPVRPIKIADYTRKAEAAGHGRNMAWQVVIHLVDQGVLEENRFRREIWRKK